MSIDAPPNFSQLCTWLILGSWLVTSVLAQTETATVVGVDEKIIEEIEETTSWLKKGDAHMFEEHHENLFPLESTDYLGFFLCLLGLMLAAGGGIGGGGILIPIYILVMDFSPKHAIALSNVTVFGGAVANIILNVRQRHPNADRPLIDWQLILLFEPVTIAGAVVGTLINSMLSETTIVVLLVMLLSFTARKTLSKAIKMYRKETIEIREQEKLASNAELIPLVKSDEDSNDDAAKVLGNTELAKVLEEEKTSPIGAIAAVVALFLFVFVVNLAKGGGAYVSPLGIECGSMAFWLANGLIVVAAAVVTLMARNWLIFRYELKERIGYEYVEGDVRWNSRATSVYPSICCLAGVAAGMFGIGGGIIKGPLMLAMGVHPVVASATSATMILFTSITATTSYAIFGLLLPEYAIVCFFFGLIATFLGQVLLSYLMRLHARNSYIAFSVGGVVLVSAFLITVQSVLSILEGEEHKSNGICGIDT